MLLPALALLSVLKTGTTTIALDPNTASIEALALLPGLGPVRAQRIVDARARRPFRRIQELRRVRGIGPKILVRLAPFLKIPAASAPPKAGPPRHGPSSEPQ